MNSIMSKMYNYSISNLYIVNMKIILSILIIWDFSFLLTIKTNKIKNAYLS